MFHCANPFLSLFWSDAGAYHICSEQQGERQRLVHGALSPNYRKRVLSLRLTFSRSRSHLALILVGVVKL
jgi:hypothetical protein